jgi:putative ABC transport system permease protein
VLTDTIRATFNQLFAQTSVGRDAVVRAVAPFGDSTGRGGRAGGNRPDTPESLLAAVRSTPGVQAAEGAVQGEVTVLNKANKPLKKQAPTLAFNWTPEKTLNVLSLRAGRGPTNGTEVTMDVGTAKSEHFALGDQVTIISNQPPKQFTIVGLTGFGKADNIAGATLVTFDTPTAQQLVGKPGYFAQIDVHAVPGTNTDALLSTLGTRLPAGFEAVSGATAAQQAAKGIESFIGTFNTFLLVFALIALFVGAFLIFNTFSIIVGQRTRELALLRALGASRGQVNRSVLGEALVVGLVGSLMGILAGVGLASGLYGLLKAFGLSLPSTSLQLLSRTVIVGLLAGTGVTLVSAILPARRASRIAPVAAMREDALEADTSLRRRAITGGTVLVAGLVVLALGLFGNAGILLVGIGAAVTFVGVAMLAPFGSGPLARLLGAPLPAIEGVAGKLGQQNAARNPRRTAATASALMIGLAVVAAVATVGASALASFNNAFNKGVTSDYVVVSSQSGGGGGSFSPVVETAIATAPGVLASSPIRVGQWHDGKSAKDLTGIDPVGGPKVLNIPIIAGSTDALAKNQVLIDDKVAKSHHLKVGDTLAMGFAATGVVPVVVGGIYTANALQFPLNSYTVSSTFLAANVNQLQDDAFAIKTATRSPSELASLAAAIGVYPNVKVETAAQFKKDQAKMVSTILTIVYVLLGLSIIIALIGVVNTLALSVMERTREIGLLRAVGMQRRQVKRMIRGEAVVVTLIGAVMGLVLGVGLGSAIVSGLSGSGIGTLAIPVSTIVVVLILTAVFGIGAAVFPARRAAKLDVLGAIATT